MTSSATTGESGGGTSRLPELVELEAALVDLLGVLRPRAALSREFKEAARESLIRGETSTTIETEADMAALEAGLDADVTFLADRLGPVAQGMASIAPEFVKVVTRVDEAVRALVHRLSGTPLPAAQQSEADEALDGVLQLLPLLSERPLAETSAGAFADYGNTVLRAILDQLTSALEVFDDQHDVLLALGEPIHSLPGRRLAPGAHLLGRPTTAPELLAAEAAASRWFDSLQLWSDAAHDFRVAAAAASARAAALREPHEPASGLRSLGSTMTPAAEQLRAAARGFTQRTTDLDTLARALLKRLRSGQLSEADERTAVSRLRSLKRFADEMAGTFFDTLGRTMPELGDAAGPEIDGSVQAMTDTAELIQIHQRIIAGWAGLPAEFGRPST